MSRLQDKVAIITGGAGGIGRAAARLFVAEGARVLLVDLDEGALEEAVAEVGGNSVSHFAGDVTRLEDNEAMVACAEERYGGVDVLLANAGVVGDVTPILNYDPEHFDRVIDINVKGPFLGIKAVVPALTRRGGGSIVITSSVAGLRGSPGLSAYVTSKHAVIGLMRSAAKELAAQNIRVNTVNPSPVETDMMRHIENGIVGGASEEAAQAVKTQMAAQIPMQRYAEADDIARVMLFLASDDSGWMTGSVNVADGGMTS
jgi:NAD(P)-dependent dehydrogenase (short-subunit alcohol dehydrogenase family)